MSGTSRSILSMERLLNMSDSPNSKDYSKSSMNAELATAETETREAMNAATIPPNETLLKRSVLYQLKAFGSSFNMSPIQLPPKTSIIKVATSDAHFVVVNEDGSVYVWGEGTRGQLGTNSLDNWKHYPSRLESVRNCPIVSASAGDGFTMLLTQSGALLTCGDNYQYVLGHELPKIFHTPTVVDKLCNAYIVEVEASGSHGLALDTDGAVYTWGSSVDGALGLGNIDTQPTPQRILLSHIKSKAERLFCGPNVSGILFANGELYVCGSNVHNKLGFNKEKVTKISAFKKINLPYKVLEACFSSVHSVYLLEGGYVVTMGCNVDGQRGLGHCDVEERPTLIEALRERFVVMCKCNDLYTIVTSEENIITFWGTRNGLPESGGEVLATKTDEDAEVGNNTAAFTNFLVSVYKSEVLSQPTDLLALYASPQQCEKGHFVTVNNVYPMPHSVLVLVDTTTPLISSLDELPTNHR